MNTKLLLQGPREDTGFMSAVNPGVRMAERIYNFCKKYHAKTQVMVSGIRKPAGRSHLLLTFLAFSNALAQFIGATLRSGRCVRVTWQPASHSCTTWSLQLSLADVSV